MRALRHLLRFCLCLALPLWAGLSQAATVTARGHSVITGDLAAARVNAITDAMRNAALQTGGEVQSHTQVTKGQVTRDVMQLDSSAQVRNIQVISESHDGSIYSVVIEADTSAGETGCTVNGYHKSVLFTGIPRQRPASTNVGGLHDVEVELPQVLAGRLYPAYDTLVQTEPGLQLSSNTRLMDNQYEQFHSVQRAAAKYQSQFVVTGQVLDMSMRYPDAYHRQNALTATGNRITSTVKDWFGGNSGDVRTRQFALRIVLHDGISGEILYDNSYQTEGVWNARHTETTGFASPRFWDTDYGQVVSELLDEVVAEIGQKILCQPFMAPVKYDAKDPDAYVLAGANHGVKVGDTLEVFTQSEAPFANIEYQATMTLVPTTYKKLQSTGSLMTVTQTYPGYSVGSFSDKLRPGQRYLVIAR